MKNIHIIPTDKPSRLWLTKLGNLTRCHDVKPIKKALGNNVNIYITYDEQLKYNDYYTVDGEKIYYCNTLNPSRNNHDKKIILTTDQDLIKDGVQSIDDEFLEWFVKNPSCEEVEVVDLWREGTPNTHDSYQIIIPKEEPKQRLEKYSERFDNKDNEIVNGIFNPDTWGKRLVDDEPKQETLQEVAERYSANELSQLGFINGAKWQEQQTIEEVFEWLTTNNYLTDLKETLIENFKNR